MQRFATLALAVSLVMIAAIGAIGAVPALAAPVVHAFDGSQIELPFGERKRIEPASSELRARVLAASLQAGGSLNKAGIVILVRSTDEAGVTPSDTDNDYTRIVDALAAAASLGDGTTIELSGTFDWTETHAFDDWAAGGYGPVAPTGLADITLTAQTLGDAVILGPGDPDTLDVYWESFLFFYGGTYQGWTVSNLELRGFDWSLGFFHASGGSTEDFNGLSVVNNRIVMPRDLNASVVADEGSQNIGIHFAFGENQLFYGNEIVIPGDSESNTLTGDLASSIAMQSNTSGGDAYDDLVITGNWVRVLNAPAIDPANDVGAPFVVGIWENGGTNASNITVSDNRFENEDPANDPADNLQRAFRLHSQASAASGKTVAYTGNTVRGAHFGLTWLAFSSAINYDDTSVPVELTGNALIDTATAIRVRSDDGDARATLRYNRVADAALGLEVDQGEADAENNWWGCNEGLDGAASCPQSLLAAGTLDAAPWLVAELTLDPVSVEPGESIGVTVDLRENSDGFDTSGIDHLPDGTPALLSTTVDGTFSSGMPATVAGVAEDVLDVAVTADPGSFLVSATVDQEMLSVGFDVTCAVDLQIANDTIDGTETFRASNVITLGPGLNVDGTSVEVVAGQRVEIGDGTAIGGSFRAGTDPAACSF